MVAIRSAPTLAGDDLAGSAAPGMSPELPPGEPDAAASPRSGAEDSARPSPSAKVFGGALALFSTQPITWAVSLLTAALLPRLFGDVGLGQYSAALALASVIGPFVTLGLQAHLLKLVAARGERAEVDVSGALALVFTVTALVAGVFALLLPLLGDRIPDQNLVRLALLSTVLGIVQGPLTACLCGRERIAGFAWLTTVQVVVSAALGFGVLYAGFGVAGYMISQMLVTVPMTVALWRMSGFRFRRQGLDLRLWLNLVRAGAPFLANDIVRWAYSELGRLLLVVLAPATVIGWFAAASRISGIAVFIPTSVTTALFPALSRHATEPDEFRRLLRRGLIGVFALTMPISALTFALAPAVPGIFGWPDTFQSSVPVLMVLSFLLPLVAMDMVLGFSLSALDLQRRWLWTAVAAAVFNVPASYALIAATQHWLGNGGIGAAVVAVATEGVIFVGGLILIPRGMLDRGTALACAGVVLAGVCCAAVATATLPIWLPLAVVAGGLAYVVTALALRVVRPSEVVMIRDYVQSTLRRRFARPR
jgi:O-antigen/teichoic acid export membrane protein